MRQFILLAFCILKISFLHSQDRDVYFLSVGISKSVNPTNKIGGANYSAREMAKLFQENGAKYGISLVSREGEIVTKSDIFLNINKLLEAAKNTGNEPFIIYYFCGHGISENFGYSHFSVPGDFTGTSKNIIENDFTDELVSTAEIFDAFDVSGYDFMMLLDNCYAQDSSEVMNDYQSTIGQLYSDVSDIVKVMNQFREPHPVIFSTVPGTSVKNVEHPFKEYALSVGPLARRSLLAARNSTDLNLSELVKHLTEGQDSKTNPGVTYWDPDYDLRIINGNKPKGILVQNKGTSISSDYEIENFGSVLSNTTELDKRTNGLFEISFSGPQDEWVSDGKNHIYSSKTKTVTVEQNSLSEIVFLYDDFGDEDWDFEFSVPEKFAVKSYRNVQRNGFQDEGNPGISISGDGRGCGDISGKFTVKKVSYDGSDKITELEIDFTQYCDGDKKPITGSLKFKLD
ncbi:caspase family protein [Cyclobacterium marinum]|uniref:caspase family protein n=1 Tax=Cyclobacterium marinum TaxID=104 RepID=UPI0011EE4F7A|nr:caspase family protein [Cyclobacterium marinum]MBI0401134.1 hypothetical protein [Cyclobacterium marinum]